MENSEENIKINGEFMLKTSLYDVNTKANNIIDNIEIILKEYTGYPIENRIINEINDRIDLFFNEKIYELNDGIDKKYFKYGIDFILNNNTVEIVFHPKNLYTVLILNDVMVSPYLFPENGEYEHNNIVYGYKQGLAYTKKVENE